MSAKPHRLHAVPDEPDRPRGDPTDEFVSRDCPVVADPDAVNDWESTARFAKTRRKFRRRGPRTAPAKPAPPPAAARRPDDDGASASTDWWFDRDIY